MVKSFLFLSLLACSVIAFSQEKITYYYGDKIKTISNYKNGVLHGKYESFFSNGTKQEVGKYKNGEKEGEWLIYEGGKLYQKIPYKKGKREGYLITYSISSGEERYRRMYINDKIHGRYDDYWSNGKLRYLAFYDHGIPIDSICNYYKNGQPESIYLIENGKKNGTAKTYSKSGHLLLTCNYKDDYKFGNEKRYYQNGQIEYVLEHNSYSNSDLLFYGDVGKHGEFQSYYENGSQRSKGKYTYGTRSGMWTCYHKNGKLKWQGKYITKEKFKDIDKTNSWEELDFFGMKSATHETGCLFLDKYKSDGRDEHQTITYIRTKQNKQSPVFGQYLGTKDSIWTYYNEKGEVISKGSYVQGKAHGDFFWKIDSGKTATGHYSNGLRDGVWKIINVENQVVFEGKWEEGRPIETWTYYNDQGEIIKVDSIFEENESIHEKQNDDIQKTAFEEMFRDLLKDRVKLDSLFCTEKQFIESIFYPLSKPGDEIKQKASGTYKRSKEMSSDHLDKRISKNELISLKIKRVKRKRECSEFIEYDFRVTLHFKEEINTLRVETIWKNETHRIKLIQSLDKNE